MKHINNFLFKKNFNKSLPAFKNYNNYDKRINNKIKMNSFSSNKNQNRNIYHKNNLVNNKYIDK